MRIAWLGTAILALGGLASGCGDDESSDGSSGSGASGTGASGTGASGTGASGTGGSGASATGGGGGDDPPPAGKCRDEEDCDVDMCLGPGDTLCGGACNMPQDPCTDDSECKGLGAEGICFVSPCNCNASEGECMLGCTSEADCADGTTCGADFRCEPAACQGEDDCPDDFSCTNDLCGRTQCETDSECDGHCVKGSCWEDYGVCGAAPGG